MSQNNQTKPNTQKEKETKAELFLAISVWLLLKINDLSTFILQSLPVYSFPVYVSDSESEGNVYEPIEEKREMFGNEEGPGGLCCAGQGWAGNADLLPSVFFRGF